MSGEAKDANFDDLAERCGDYDEAPQAANEPVRLDIDLRLTKRVTGGKQTLAIIPATGPAKAPRYVYPAAAKEGDTLELYAAGERLFGDRLVRCTKVQAISMQRNPDYSQVGRDTAAFPCYDSEEKALTEMDGHATNADRFARYCADGKSFNGHIIFWKVDADAQA